MNWKGFVLAGAVPAGMVCYRVGACRMVRVARASEHLATLERFTQEHSWWGGGRMAYYFRREDGRIDVIPHAVNQHVQVGSRVPLIELKTAEGGTPYKFKDN